MPEQNQNDSLFLQILEIMRKNAFLLLIGLCLFFYIYSAPETSTVPINTSILKKII